MEEDPAVPQDTEGLQLHGAQGSQTLGCFVSDRNREQDQEPSTLACWRSASGGGDGGASHLSMMRLRKAGAEEVGTFWVRTILRKGAKGAGGYPG